MLSLSWRLNSLASSIALHGVASGSCLDGGRFFNTISKEKYYPAEEQIGQALDGSDLVIIPIDTPMEPDITNDDLFKINAGIVKPFC